MFLRKFISICYILCFTLIPETLYNDTFWWALWLGLRGCTSVVHICLCTSVIAQSALYFLLRIKEVTKPNMSKLASFLQLFV